MTDPHLIAAFSGGNLTSTYASAVTDPSLFSSCTGMESVAEFSKAIKAFEKNRIQKYNHDQQFFFYLFYHRIGEPDSTKWENFLSQYTNMKNRPRDVGNFIKAVKATFGSFPKPDVIGHSHNHVSTSPFVTVPLTANISMGHDLTPMPRFSVASTSMNNSQGTVDATKSNQPTSINAIVDEFGINLNVNRTLFPAEDRWSSDREKFLRGKPGKNKYDLNLGFLRHETDQTEALLVAAACENGDDLLATSPEFVAYIQSYKPLESADGNVSVSDISDEITRKRIYRLQVLSPDCFNAAILGSSLDVEHRTWNSLFSSKASSGQFVFHPSKDRSDKLLEFFDLNCKTPNDRYHHVIVVEPNEALKYAEFVLSQKPNFLLLILPLNNQAMGYCRFIIQKVADLHGLEWIWMVDDSVGTIHSCSGADDMTQLSLYEMCDQLWNRLIITPSLEGSLDKVITVGTTKLTALDKKNFKSEIVYNYASSTILLHVTAACRNSVYFDPDHKIAEDICFAIRCTHKRLVILRDKFFGHKKIQYYGGASHFTNVNNRISGLESRAVEDGAPYQLKATAQFIDLPSSIVSGAVSNKFVDMNSGQRRFTVFSTGTVDSIQLASRRVVEDSSSQDFRISLTSGSCDTVLHVCQGNRKQNAYALGRQGGRISEIYSIYAQEADFSITKVSNEINEVVAMTAFGDTCFWLAYCNGTKKCVDMRCSYALSSVYDIKRIAAVVDIVALNETQTLSMHATGEMRVYDVRNSAVALVQEKLTFHRELLKTCPDAQQGRTMKPKISVLQGESGFRCLLTYNKNGHPEKRNAIVLNNTFRRLNGKDCTFDYEPTFLLNPSGEAVVACCNLDRGIQSARVANKMMVWTESNDTCVRSNLSVESESRYGFDNQQDCVKLFSSSVGDMTFAKRFDEWTRLFFFGF